MVSEERERTSEVAFIKKVEKELKTIYFLFIEKLPKNF